jgi:hypothetical protein
VTIDELRREALRLDPSARADLARDLLTSLDELSEAEVEQLWLEEAVRRHDEVASGQVHTVEMEDVFSDARTDRR